MRTAILDLGTNTFHLLIADIHHDGTFDKIYKNRKAVKLLEGAGESQIIQPIPFQRGVEVMKKFSEKINKHKIEKVFANGTSAIRSSHNGSDFIKEIKSKTGIDVQIITGDEEAELIYFGVKQSLNVGSETALILDIGGGSNEFIICNQNKIFWQKSFNLGAARLLEMFPLSDPVSEKEILYLNQIFEKELQELFIAMKKYPVTNLIGSSGSFDTFADLICEQFLNQTFSKKKKEFEFNMNEYREIADGLLKSTLSERKNMKGLVEMRVDMIVISCIFTDFIIEKFGITRMRLSKGAMKEGILSKIISSELKTN